MDAKQSHNRLKQHQVVKLVNYLQSVIAELDGQTDAAVAARCTIALGFDVAASNINYIRLTPDYECTWRAARAGKSVADEEVKMIAREILSICNALASAGMPVQLSERFVVFAKT